MNQLKILALTILFIIPKLGVAGNRGSKGSFCQKSSSKDFENQVTSVKEVDSEPGGGDGGSKDTPSACQENLEVVPAPILEEGHELSSGETEEMSDMSLGFLDESEAEEEDGAFEYEEGEGFWDHGVIQGCVVQNQAEGTTFACGILSVMTAYNACKGIKDHSFFSKGNQIVFNDILKTYGPRVKIKMKNVDGKLVESFNTINVGNKSWARALDFLDLEVSEFPIESASSKEQIRLIKEVIKKKGSVLLFHAPCHYTCIGGYAESEGKMYLLVSWDNQKPSEWAPLDEIIYIIKTGRNKKFLVATNKPTVEILEEQVEPSV